MDTSKYESISPDVDVMESWRNGIILARRETINYEDDD